MVLMPDYYRGKTKDPFNSPPEETKAFLIQVQKYIFVWCPTFYIRTFSLLWISLLKLNSVQWTLQQLRKETEMNAGGS